MSIMQKNGFNEADKNTVLKMAGQTEKSRGKFSGDRNP